MSSRATTTITQVAQSIVEEMRTQQNNRKLGSIYLPAPKRVEFYPKLTHHKGLDNSDES